MKESEIRSAERHSKYLEMVREDARRYFPDPKKFHAVSCFACGSNDAKEVFKKDVFSYVQCPECDTFFVNPRPTLDDLIRFYTDSPSTSYWVNEFFQPFAEARREKMFKPRALEIYSKFLNKNISSVGDIGAGFGIFLSELKKVWGDVSLSAIEPSREMAAICREQGFSVVEAPIEHVSASEHQFDLLTSFELLEHLYDPFDFVKGIFRLLRPGGYVVLTTPNGLGFDVLNLWENSKTIFPPHHINFFNPWSMRRLLTRAGFEEPEVTTPGKLDWDILEKAVDQAPRFFGYVSKYGSRESKEEFQQWITKSCFSSHMQIIARKPL